jgi:hypothetical protein
VTLTVNGWPQNRLRYCAECKRAEDRDRHKRERGHAVTQTTVTPRPTPPSWVAY